MRRRNNTLRYVIIFVILLVLSYYIYYRIASNTNNTNVNTNTNQDNIKFKAEYEALNDTKNDDDTNKYISINLPEQNLIRYTLIDEIFNILDGGTGIIYFGMPECPWCRNMLPVLIDAAKSNQIGTIYYYNPKNIRDENSQEYQKLVNLLKDFLLTDTATQKETDKNFDKNKKRLYMPDVFFIKDGEIVGDHKSTVESQKDPKIALTKDQYNDLKKIYTDYIKKMNGTCDDSSGVCE